LRYGLALASIAVAVLITEPLEGHIDTMPFFYAAVVMSAWLGGIGPGLFAVFLATLAIDYFLVPPLYELTLKVEHLPRLVAFALSALLVSWLSIRRRRVEDSLRLARDEQEIQVQERTADLERANVQLQAEIAERKQAEQTLERQAAELREQAQLLDLAHDAILVRDLEGRIGFWNRGAAVRYGWSRDEALGKI
jgi:PAS domain-containing protein